MKAIIKETEDKMKKSTDRLAHEFTTIPSAVTTGS